MLSNEQFENEYFDCHQMLLNKNTVLQKRHCIHPLPGNVYPHYKNYQFYKGHIMLVYQRDQYLPEV